MDKIKGKYEVILGFVTLVISLSAFKDELEKVHIDLGWRVISLAQYLLYSVYGLGICLYLYIIEQIARETTIGAWKIFDYTIWGGFILFSFILLTPFLLLINIIVAKVYIVITQKAATENAQNFFQISSLVLLIINLISSIKSVLKYTKSRKMKLQVEITEQEIIELENASRLFQDGYYSNSVFETFKVLETHLYKRLLDKDIRVQRYNQRDLIQFSLKHGIITDKDMPIIDHIRGMRNIAAHSDTEHTKEQAKYALEFVRQLLKRNESENLHL